MLKSKLLILLKSLSTRELRNLKDFVTSPYHNKNQYLIRFYNYLYNTAPYFKAELMDWGDAFEHVFESQTFDRKRFYHLESKMVKLVEKFLVQEAFKKDEFVPELYLLKSSLDKSLPKNYNETSRQLKLK